MLNLERVIYDKVISGHIVVSMICDKGWT